MFAFSEVAEQQSVRFEQGSFRDRSARIAFIGDRVARFLSSEAVREWNVVSKTEFWRKARSSGEIISSEAAPDFDIAAHSVGFDLAIEHPRLSVVLWPWEWSFSMLKDAALAQLHLMETSLNEHCILKDATPFNFQFVQQRAVLIDVGSIVTWKLGQAWPGYRQFCQMFLYPLMLQAWKHIDFQPWLRGSLEGILATQFASLLTTRDMFRRGAFSHVWLHAMLQNSSQHQTASRSLETEGFSREMIIRNVQGLQKVVAGLTWTPKRSTWSGYHHEAPHVAVDRAAKERVVLMACQESMPRTVWDLGCNQGHYSRLAAQFADHVLAMDADHLTIDRLYQSLRTEQNDRIHPVVYNIADPTPSLGWRHEERRDLRQRSQPQLILCLALIHHLVISNNLLLPDVIEWLSEYRSHIVLEWVDRSDPLVQQLLLNRSDVFSDYSEATLRQAISKHFVVRHEERLPSGHRILFHLEARC